MAKEIFGIELEVPLRQGVTCNDFRNCLAEAIGHELVHFMDSNRRVGYHSPEYNSNVDKWRVASDGSLDWSNGVEIVSRRRTTLEETKKAMEATRHLVDLELLRTTSCGGHHVHIGVMHFSAIKRTYKPENTENCTRYRSGPCRQMNCEHCEDMQKLVRTKRVKLLDIKIHEVYSYFQPVIDALVSRSRRSATGNIYCRGVSSRYHPNNGGSEGAKERYLNNRESKAPLWGNRGVVNFGQIDNYGTIEYRQHQQTYHVATVQNWVRLMHRLTSRCWVQETKNIDPRDYDVTVDGFADFLGLGENRLRAWMRRRANHFGFSAIARENGVNPVVGSRDRQHSRLRSAVSSLSPELREALTEISGGRSDENIAIDRLYNAIVLACANHEETYDLIRFAYVEVGSLSARNLKEICENNIPNSYLPELYTMQTWDNLNWESIRSEVIEGLAE